MNLGYIFRGAIMQIVVFSFNPFVYWLIKYKKQTPFFQWIGLFKPIKNVSYKKAIVSIVCYFLIWIIASLVSKPSSNYTGIGVVAIFPSLIVCFIQNGLCEELLFRGFIGKRLISKLGKNKGNITQAIVFGAVHILLAIATETPINILNFIGFFIVPVVGGWTLGYINEYIYNGSIIPSIILHGIINFLRDMILAFS